MNSFLEDLAHPPTRHAMFVHMPIVLAMLGVPLALASAIVAKNRTLRTLTLVLYAVLIVASFITVRSGDRAELALNAVTDDANRVLNQHENMGVLVWLFASLTLALVLISTARHRIARPVGAWAAVVLSVVTLWWVAKTASLGGTLVYRHGLGVSISSTSPTNSSTTLQAPMPEATVNAAEPPPNQSAVALASIQTLLEENCTRCHNASRVADGKSGLLDQTSRDAMLKGGRSGPAIVPGQPEQSLLIARIRSMSEDDRMPPAPRKPLSEQQIHMLERWIEQGALWPNPQDS